MIDVTANVKQLNSPKNDGITFAEAKNNCGIYEDIDDMDSLLIVFNGVALQTTRTFPMDVELAVSTTYTKSTRFKLSDVELTYVLKNDD